MSKNAQKARPNLLQRMWKNLVVGVLPGQENNGQELDLDARNDFHNIPVNLLQRIRQTLTECRALQTDHGLEPIFIDQRIHRYSGNLAQSYDVASRINSVMMLLHNKAHQNAFVSFLEVLRDHTPVEDFQRQHLQSLIDELKKLLGYTEIESTSKPGETGIPFSLYLELLHVLEGHPVFSSNQNLRDLFDVAPLLPWRIFLRDNVKNERERVEFLITDFFSRYNADGQNVLAVFLHVLSEHEFSDPELKSVLVNLAQEVEQVLKNPLASSYE